MKHITIQNKNAWRFSENKKLGAVSPNGESTPFVWNNRLFRLEPDDAANGVDSGSSSAAVIRDRETGKIISRLAEGCYDYSFCQENNTAYVLGTKRENGMRCGDTIVLFESKDLLNWSSRALVTRKDWQFFKATPHKG